MKKSVVVIGALATAAVLAACGPDGSSGTGVSSTSATATTTGATSSPTVAGSPQAAPFTATTVTLVGNYYRVDVPQVEGGTDVARFGFNRAMQDGVVQWISHNSLPMDSVTSRDGEMVRIGSRVLSGHLIVTVYGDGAAHPNSFDLAQVTDIDTGQSITLPDLFTDLQQGLNTLSIQAEALVRQNPRATGYSKSLLTPVAEHFQTWVATPEGMRIYLGEISSHAAGNIDVTMPWSALDSVLKPGVRAVVSS
ncbi:RsiV family protein [Nocardia vinacea]|uniref:RsiV family protein n=1 Tax=Nocardia vinacea TaxID=96468 RepID=UPI00030EFACE|nr:RsiV family protein [Nocardia vinacea]